VKNLILSFLQTLTLRHFRGGIAKYPAIFIEIMRKGIKTGDEKS
jgi:hypothetical protein